MPYKDPEKNKECSRRCAINRSRRKRDFIRSEKVARGGCEKCGELDPIVLVFHHISDDKHDWLKYRGGRRRRGLQDLNWGDLKTEVQKCVVLCFNCHAKLHEELEPSKDVV